jgi:1-deoxy-D-xylulose-5-phosphate reductoisomerase
MSPRRVVILGSTGSIGRQALEVAETIPDRVRITGLGARRDAETLGEQVRRFQPEAVALSDPGAAQAFRAHVPEFRGAFQVGEGALEWLARWPGADLVLVALTGIAGLRPTLSAIEAGHDVALANKETLVAAGHLVRRAVANRGVRLIPVDGEHSAIFQLLEGRDPSTVARVVLTASGGPFLRRPLASLRTVTPEEALQHPTWRMGPKVTVDSATLMNKGLEVIEARWLFDLPPHRIEVVIHPQSVVHGMVELVDGTTLAHLSPPDMRLFIQYAFTYPDRVGVSYARMDWSRPQALTFEPPDPRRFPCLGYAYEALGRGGTAPAVLNAANEVAVERFLRREMAFVEIPKAVRLALDLHDPVPDPSLEEILEADRWARALVWGL